jgi:hypothetical protein
MVFRQDPSDQPAEDAKQEQGEFDNGAYADKEGTRSGDDPSQQLQGLSCILEGIEQDRHEHAVSSSRPQAGEPTFVPASREQGSQGTRQGVGGHEKIIQPQAESSEEASSRIP